MIEAAIDKSHGGPLPHQVIRFIPMGISKVSDIEVCVGAISEDGSWVRPETPTFAEIKAQNSSLTYFQRSYASLGTSLEPDPRPEDRHMFNAAHAEEHLPKELWETFIKKHLDNSAEAAFAGLRSLGLIKVRVHRFYIKKSTGGRSFLRTEFTDASDQTYDWIISEVRFQEAMESCLHKGDIPVRVNEELVTFLDRAEVFFTLALTKPNNRFPGKFRGCHPVIIGIHTFPDYLGFLPSITL